MTPHAAKLSVTKTANDLFSSRLVQQVSYDLIDAAIVQLLELECMQAVPEVIRQQTAAKVLEIAAGRTQQHFLSVL